MTIFQEGLNIPNIISFRIAENKVNIKDTLLYTLSSIGLDLVSTREYELREPIPIGLCNYQEPCSSINFNLQDSQDTKTQNWRKA